MLGLLKFLSDLKIDQSINNTLIPNFIYKFLQYKTIFEIGTPESNRYDNYVKTPISENHHMFFIAISHFYQIPITTQRQPYIWNGQHLDITQLSSLNHQMHEVGHYLMCPCEYINHIDYGLGSGGAYDVEVARDNTHEDILASIFGLYLQYLIDDDISISIGNVGVDEVLTPKYLIDCFNHFMKLGIINKNGLPSYKTLKNDNLFNSLDNYEII